MGGGGAPLCCAGFSPAYSGCLSGKWAAAHAGVARCGVGEGTAHLGKLGWGHEELTALVCGRDDKHLHSQVHDLSSARHIVA